MHHSINRRHNRPGFSKRGGAVLEELNRCDLILHPVIAAVYPRAVRLLEFPFVVFKGDQRPAAVRNEHIPLFFIQIAVSHKGIHINASQLVLPCLLNGGLRDFRRHARFRQRDKQVEGNPQLFVSDMGRKTVLCPGDGLFRILEIHIGAGCTVPFSRIILDANTRPDEIPPERAVLVAELRHSGPHLPSGGILHQNDGENLVVDIQGKSGIAGDQAMILQRLLRQGRNGGRYLSFAGSSVRKRGDIGYRAGTSGQQHDRCQQSRRTYLNF